MHSGSAPAPSEHSPSTDNGLLDPTFRPTQRHCCAARPTSSSLLGRSERLEAGITKTPLHISAVAVAAAAVHVVHMATLAGLHVSQRLRLQARTPERLRARDGVAKTSSVSPGFVCTSARTQRVPVDSNVKAVSRGVGSRTRIRVSPSPRCPARPSDARPRPVLFDCAGWEGERPRLPMAKPFREHGRKQRSTPLHARRRVEVSVLDGLAYGELAACEYQLGMRGRGEMEKFGIQAGRTRFVFIVAPGLLDERSGVHLGLVFDRRADRFDGLGHARRVWRTPSPPEGRADD
ncbi:hypothetical protein LXA43DRAFT_664590 [Ganoderma leucocontextum]|nr:hypothetical protein LXA43DRAFT_664590 [Ganoderma leucocontextum]